MESNGKDNNTPGGSNPSHDQEVMASGPHRILGADHDHATEPKNSRPGNNTEILIKLTDRSGPLEGCSGASKTPSTQGEIAKRENNETVQRTRCQSPVQSATWSYAMADDMGSDSTGSMLSISSTHTQQRPRGLGEAPCTPGEKSRFWRPRKRTRQDDEESSCSDTPTLSRERTKPGYQRARRVERESEAEAELAVLNEKPTETGTVGNARKRIEENLAAVDKVARCSMNLKGTFVAALKKAVAAIRKDADSLAEKTLSDETRALQLENERLRAQLNLLQGEMRELRLILKGAPKDHPTVNVEEMEARILRQVGEHINAQLKDLGSIPNLEPPLLPLPTVDSKKSKKGKPPLKSPRSRDPLTSSAALKTKRKKATVQTQATRKEEQNSLAKVPRKEMFGGNTPASSPASAIVLPPTRPSLATNNEEGWTMVTKKRRKAATVTQKNVTASKSEKPPARSLPKLKVPRTAAIVLTLPKDAEAKGVTYAAALKEARAQIDLKEAGIEGVKFRRAATGATIIQIPGAGSGEKADILAKRLKTVLSDSGVKISRPIRCADVRISGLDDSITADELREAIAAKGECLADQIRISNIRQDRSGLGAAWVNCPITATKKLLAGRFLVGWVAANISVAKPRELRCFRCLQVGHVASRCMSDTDRSQLCFRCGQADHRAASCSAKPKCLLCDEAGRKADHRLGGNSCTAPSVKFSRRHPSLKKKSPAKSPRNNARMEVI